LLSTLRDRSAQEADRGWLLVFEHFDVSETRVVVDAGVYELPADATGSVLAHAGDAVADL
jgi:hypothetical protein